MGRPGEAPKISFLKFDFSLFVLISVATSVSLHHQIKPKNVGMTIYHNGRQRTTTLTITLTLQT